nr:GntR family transcriptional regulator [Glaciihabitans tibetensis]
MLTVDPRSATPPFEQIRVQIIGLITSGAMVVGTRLPTVRRLAADLGIAPNTVARAYKELEAAEFIQTRGRAGSFVTARQDTPEYEAMAAATAYLARARELGFSSTEAVAFVTASLDA